MRLTHKRTDPARADSSRCNMMAACNAEYGVASLLSLTSGRVQTNSKLHTRWSNTGIAERPGLAGRIARCRKMGSNSQLAVNYFQLISAQTLASRCINGATA